VQSIPSVIVSPLIADRCFDLSVEFDFSPGDEGVLYALGDRFTGLLAFVQNNQLHFVWQRWMRPVELAPIALESGHHVFTMHYRALEKRQGEADFVMDERTVLSSVTLSPTPIRLPSGGLDVGINRRQAISERIEGRQGFPYSGRISVVAIKPGAQASGSPMVLDESLVQARMRALEEKK
jgi:hypothetical protein